MDTRFTASLLRSSASGFAAMAVSRAFETLEPGDEPSEGFEAWRSHFQTLVMELAAAVEDSQPDQFGARVVWTRDAFVARNQQASFLRTGLDAMGCVLQEALPSEAWANLPRFFGAAVRELERDVPVGTIPDGPDAEFGDLARVYLDAIRDGDAQGAVDGVIDAIQSGRLSASDALDQVLTPALREVGRLWHLGTMNIAQEHFATQATGRLLERILLGVPTPLTYNRTVVLAMAEGDAHDLGLRIVAAFFELDGWRTICLGANTPSKDLAATVIDFDADLVVLGATLNTHRDAVATAIGLLRAERPDQNVLVGGSAFGGLEDRALEIGANGSVALARQAPAMGRQLVG